MASIISLSVFLSTVSASYTSESRREQHPLCRALDDRKQQQPAFYPLAYACHGDHGDAICNFLNTDTQEARASKTKDELEAVTWWVYEGQREQASPSAGDFSDDAWVDCTDYYARSGSALGPSKYVEDDPRRPYEVSSEHTTATGGRAREPRPSTAIGPPRALPLSQSLRTLREDDARGSARVDIESSPSSPIGEENGRMNPDGPRTGLVYAPDARCDDIWLSWPAMHDKAIADGTFIRFRVGSSVGNLFIVFDTVMKFARFLDLGLVLDWTDVPGFRAAFEPGGINWDVDVRKLVQPTVEPTGTSSTRRHSLEFSNFAMVLSDSQLELLAFTLGIHGENTDELAAHIRTSIPGRVNLFMRMMRQTAGRKMPLTAQPCTWNMMFSRSASMIASLEQYSPWGVASDATQLRHHPAEYVAWHIRTADGETANSYKPTKHKYVLQEPSSDVCPTYLTAQEQALELVKTCRASLSAQDDNQLVYISSNSKSMAKNCTVEAAEHDVIMGHVDLGLSPRDAHTAHSRKPLETALGALLDFFFLLDATVIVRTGSSFSGTVCKVKGLTCHKIRYNALPKRTMMLCVPSDC